MLALLVVPAAAAVLTLAVAGPAGDTFNDSVALLFGAPAVASALATFALAGPRPPIGTAGGWALGSAVAATVLFAVAFVALVIGVCALDTDGCS